MPKNKPPKLEMRYDGKELTLHLGGKLIAKRGEPGTPQARTWVSLDPNQGSMETRDDGDLRQLRERVLAAEIMAAISQSEVSGRLALPPKEACSSGRGRAVARATVG
jgi:hypothetical protein